MLSIHKYLYWRPEMEKEDAGDGKMTANLHFLFLPGENQGTLLDFQNMAKHLRKTFPEATDDKIFVAKIIKSSRFKGYFILIWNDRIKIQNYPNWLERKFNEIEYLW